MRIFLTGGTGYIGRNVVRSLTQRGDECVVLSRRAAGVRGDSGARVIHGDPTQPGPWQQELGQVDAVVSLAGAPIVEPPKRWTANRKHTLRRSRVETTRRVVEGIRAAHRPPRVLVSASAIGYYGARGDETLDETASAGRDFLADLAVAWESAAREAASVTRVALIRTGMVLGAGAPVLAPMVPLFKAGLGGSWGDGRAWWSWIHVADEVGLILMLLDRDVQGPFNLTAPSPVTVEQFTGALGRLVNRPVLLRVPAWALRLALGEAADALLHLQRVTPRRALEAGYAYRYTDIEGALREALHGPTR